MVRDFSFLAADFLSLLAATLVVLDVVLIASIGTYELRVFVVKTELFTSVPLISDDTLGFTLLPLLKLVDLEQLYGTGEIVGKVDGGGGETWLVGLFDSHDPAAFRELPMMVVDFIIG